MELETDYIKNEYYFYNLNQTGLSLLKETNHQDNHTFDAKVSTYPVNFYN